MADKNTLDLARQWAADIDADPRKTLADMAPEERQECQWMQCEVPGLDKTGIIIHVRRNGCNVLYREGAIEITTIHEVIPLPDLPRMEWPSSIPVEGVPEGDPIEIADNDHASHCASCAEMDDDEPEFDPAYTYRDREGDEWEHLYGRWITGDTYAERVAERRIHPGHDSLPAAYGPYTRIEGTNE